MLDYWDQPTLRMRRVYTVLIVWALSTAETGGAKGRGGALAPFYKYADRQSNRSDLWIPSYATTEVWFPEKGDHDYTADTNGRS